MPKKIVLIALTLVLLLARPVRAEMPALGFQDGTILVFLATDDQEAARMREGSGERTIMVMLIAPDFQMTEAVAERIKADICLMGETDRYPVRHAHLAEAESGNNPDLELYFSVPEEQIDALNLVLDGKSVPLSAAPRTFLGSVEALIDVLSPSDLTVKVEPGVIAAAKIPVIDALNSQQRGLYAEALEYLKDENVFAEGSKKHAKAFQQLIAALGGDIAVDGRIGKKTMDAFRAVTYGYIGTPDAPKSAADAQAFEEMLKNLLLKENARAAKQVLTDDEIAYYTAAAHLRAGHLPDAHAAYEKLGNYRFSKDYLSACKATWPKDGEVFRSEALEGDMHTLHVKSALNEGMASYVKIYKGDQVALTLFVRAKGTVRAMLPEGEYTVAVGAGRTWFGEEDAFGDQDAFYLKLKFDGQYALSIKPDYSYTLTLASGEDEAGAYAEIINYGDF